MYTFNLKHWDNPHQDLKHLNIKNSDLMQSIHSTIQKNRL